MLQSLREKAVCLLVGLALIAGPFAAAAAAQDQGQGTPEKPAEAAEQKEGPPSTVGPIITDTAIPIEAHHLSMTLGFFPTFFPANTTSNWRQVSYGSNFFTLFMPLKITYGPMKDWETYIVVPYVQQWISGANAPAPNGSTSAGYAGIGDISWFNKYLFWEETDSRPAVTGVFGVGFPSGHASHLNPNLLNTDAIGTGSLAFTSGFDFFKYLKPLVFNANLWFTAPVNLYQDRPDNVRSREYVTFNLSAEYPLTKQWTALLEWFSDWSWTNISTPQGYQSPYTYMGILPGLEYQLNDKWAFSTGAAFYLAAKQGAIQYMPILTVNYSF